MTRPVDADALYMELVKMKDFGELTAKKAIRVVKNAPTIDAVPKNDYKKALDCILAAYLNPEIRHDILEKFVFETFSVGEVKSEPYKGDREC